MMCAYNRYDDVSSVLCAYFFKIAYGGFKTGRETKGTVFRRKPRLNLPKVPE